MKAVVRAAYCAPGQLTLDDLDQPTPGAHDVLVRVRAAGVDQGVWHVVTGLPYVVRLGLGPRTPKVRIPGRDVAGTIEAVGTEVTRFRPGDEVFGTCQGTYAEYACGPASGFAGKPTNVTFEQAAATPTSGMTALQALRLDSLTFTDASNAAQVDPVGQLDAAMHVDSASHVDAAGHVDTASHVHTAGHVDSSDRTGSPSVLVIGAAGGVGTFAVQLAKAAGATVIGVCRTDKAALVRSLGADDVMDYASADRTTRRFDLIIDTGGNRSLPLLRKTLTPRGTLVLVGAEHVGGRWLQGFDRQLRASALSPFVQQRLVALLTKPRQADLERLRMCLESGLVKPVVDRTFALTEVPAAVRHLREGHPGGKVVIVV
jgi:NADPH:quinone reductase-like Zn-dependent oxidoreductase